MKPDLTALAEPLRLLTPAPFPAHKHGGIQMENTHSPRTLGQAGAHLFKSEGKYWLTAAAVRDRMGGGCWDTFVSGSDSLDGPFSSPMLMAPHGGQTTVFDGPGGSLHASFAGRDSRAAFRDRPAADPLVFSSDVLYGRERVAPFPRKKPGVMTEFGPWADIQPAAQVQIRDLQFSGTPDGFFYLTGSGTHNSYVGKIMLFRSKDMKAWEPVDVQFDPLTIPGFTQADYKARFEDPRHQASLGAKFMDSEIYHFDGTFHLFASLYRGPKLPDGTNAKSWGMWLRSTTGKPEGPYEDFAYLVTRGGFPSFFQDDDGSVYLVFADGWFAPLAKDLKTLAAARKPFTLASAAPGQGLLFPGDRGVSVFKRDGKYHLLAARWEVREGKPSHDATLWTAESFQGPYAPSGKALANSGPVTVFQTTDNTWKALPFAAFSTGPTPLEIPSP